MCFEKHMKLEKRIRFKRDFHSTIHMVCMDLFSYLNAVCKSCGQSDILHLKSLAGDIFYSSIS